MRILFITTSHNSLSQRAEIELTDRGHEVSIELALSDEIITSAVELFHPDLILCPMLKTAIPENIWRNHVCLIVHPGIRGDRGPSSLDWAILDGMETWGVTILQAQEEMDAGDIWSSHLFPMRSASKSSIYRNEVVDAAILGILEAVSRFESRTFFPEPLDYSHPEIKGRLHIPIRPNHRKLNWGDTTEVILRKVRSADSSPGLLDSIFDEDYFIFGVHSEISLRGRPGDILAQRNGAICKATGDTAVWISHLKKRGGIKLPAMLALQGKVDGLPFYLTSWDCTSRNNSAASSFLFSQVLGSSLTPASETFQEIEYSSKNGVGYLKFDFYNGAMSTEQSRRLLEAYRFAKEQPTRVIVLVGGEFWSNGIHLNVIEASENPAQESWENIHAINDLIREIITTPDQLTISGITGNAGAGGVIMAMATDRIFAREGIVLNPHYKTMGGLHGSEYWTYLLPKRVGKDLAKDLIESCQPLGVRRALEIELIDETLAGGRGLFLAQLMDRAEDLARHPEHDEMIDLKKRMRAQDEAHRPLESYRAEELLQMEKNFFGPDPSYHQARRRFVYKTRPSETPLHQARHRNIGHTPPR